MTSAKAWFWRGFGTALLVVAVPFASLVALVTWREHVGRQSVDREYLYRLALDEATARTAEPTTAKLFWTSTEPAPGATTGDMIPCPKDAAALRREGAGACFLFNFGGRHEEPWYCDWAPCASLDIGEHAWSDPAVRRAVEQVRHNPRAVCDARRLVTHAGWRDTATSDLIECGPWRAFRGFVFLHVYRDQPRGDGDVIMAPERLRMEPL